MEDEVEKIYLKDLNAEELTLLIKDRFMNWKDLVMIIYVNLFPLIAS